MDHAWSSDSQEAIVHDLGNRCLEDMVPRVPSRGGLVYSTSRDTII